MIRRVSIRRYSICKVSIPRKSKNNLHTVLSNSLRRALTISLLSFITHLKVTGLYRLAQRKLMTTIKISEIFRKVYTKPQCQSDRFRLLITQVGLNPKLCVPLVLINNITSQLNPAAGATLIATMLTPSNHHTTN